MKTQPRLPGERNHKLKYLSTLSEETLPDLVCDVLHFCHGYSGLKVVDGPGDGRRDIRGKSPEGEDVVAQCKFHTKFGVAVGSRETDEIAIALAKFGATRGVFATTGKISPQAIREYESNYPGYQLRFLDGTDLVDAVLGHPVLKTVWTNGQQFGLQTLRLVVPLIMRATEPDWPMDATKLLKGVALEKECFSIESRQFDESDFAPYRPPSVTAIVSESFATRVSGYGFEHVTCAPLTRLSNEAQRMVDAALKMLPTSEPLFQIRFGRPHISSADGSDASRSCALSEFEPQTFVVPASSATPIPEQDWILPQGSGEWQFPMPGFGTLEADWVGWYSAALDCVLIPHLSEPLDPKYDGDALVIRKMHSLALERSLFLGCSDRDAEKLIASLPESQQPTWTCRGVRTERVLGWVHPAYYGAFSFKQGEGFSLSLPEPKDLSPDLRNIQDAFEQTCEHIRLATSGLECQTVEWTNAVSLSQHTDEPLLTPADRILRRSAELFYYFEEVRSPLRLDNRTHVYVQIWSVPCELEEFQTWQKQSQLHELESEVHVQTNKAPIANKLMPMFSLVSQIAPGHSAEEAMRLERSTIEQDLAKISIMLTKRWPTARTATESFWRTEIGLVFK